MQMARNGGADISGYPGFWRSARGAAEEKGAAIM